MYFAPNLPKSIVNQSISLTPFSSISSFSVSFPNLDRQKMYFEVFDASGSGKIFAGKVEATVGELFNGREKGVTK